MINTIIGRNIIDQEGIDILKATDVITILLRIGSPLMMRINAADRAEIMLRGKCIELIKAQNIFALDDFDSGQRD